MLVLALSGCAQFDPSLPIEVQPDSSWTNAEKLSLAAAAECWNYRFGTQLRVVEEARGDQVARVSFNELACWAGPGRFTPGQVAQVDICPLDLWEKTLPGIAAAYPMPVRLFAALAHEMGRVASIEDESHLDVPDMVMGEDLQAVFAYRFLRETVAFSPEDAELLHEASPDFVPAPYCEHVDMVYDTVTGARCSCE